MLFTAFETLFGKMIPLISERHTEAARGLKTKGGDSVAVRQGRRITCADCGWIGRHLTPETFVKNGWEMYEGEPYCPECAEKLRFVLFAAYFHKLEVEEEKRAKEELKRYMNGGKRK